MEKHEKVDFVFGYLNKYYNVTDGVFMNRYNQQEWGYDIARELTIVCSFDRELCLETFKRWAENRGIFYDESNAFGPRKLKVTWSPELAQDMRSSYDIDAETALITILSEEIAKEIDAQILIDLKRQIPKEDFMGVMKCVGYEPSPTIYDPTTFSPRRGFISIKKDEIENARQNNTYWQDWIRTRGQDNKA